MVNPVRVETHPPDLGARAPVIGLAYGIIEQKLRSRLGCVDLNWHDHRRPDQDALRRSSL